MVQQFFSVAFKVSFAWSMFIVLELFRNNVWCVLLLQVFSDQLLLQDVLARSDRAMAVVKDLFGDAPRRQTGRKPLIPSQL